MIKDSALRRAEVATTPISPRHSALREAKRESDPARLSSHFSSGLLRKSQKPARLESLGASPPQNAHQKQEDAPNEPFKLQNKLLLSSFEDNSRLPQSKLPSEQEPTSMTHDTHHKIRMKQEMIESRTGYPKKMNQDLQLYRNWPQLESEENERLNGKK